ncbi:MAG: MFS transporter [Candidatus Woesearchaeota archaeon]
MFGGVLVPFFLDWGSITFTQLMILQSFFVFSMFILEIPTGAVADYFGRKTSISLSAVFIALSVIIYTIYPNFYLFLLGEFFWAIGAALLSGSDQALLYDSLKKLKSEKQSKKIFGRYGSLELTGMMIAAPIGSLVAAEFGLRMPMLLMIIPFTIAFLIALTLKEPIIKESVSKNDLEKLSKKTTANKTRKTIADKTKKINSNSISSKIAHTESMRYWNTLVSGIRYFRGHKILQLLAFDSISITALVFFIIWTYQPLLQQLGVPILYFGFVHAGLAGIQVLFMNHFEFLEKLFGSKKNYLLWSAIISKVEEKHLID